MKQTKPLRTLAALVLVAASMTAIASGSDGAGGAETGDAQAYNNGKMIYAQKLACSGCSFAGKTLDASLAQQVLSGKAVTNLSDEEGQALTVYLKRRFKL